MKRICKQCGKEFILTQDEIAFYKSKNLHIPKRCETCRRENRENGKAGKQMEPGQVVRAYHGKENNRKKPWAVVMAVLILLAVVILESRMGLIPDQNGGTVQEQTEQMPTGEMAVIAEAENPPKTSDDVLPDDAVEELPSEETADAELSTVEPAAVSSPAVTYTYNFRKADVICCEL